MASSMTATVYVQVIEDVISKVRDEFVNDGAPGDSVLNELQAMWEMKMMQAGVVCAPIERPSAPRALPGGSVTPVGDLNMPYEATEEYETPTAEMLFPPTPLQTPIQTPLPGAADFSTYNIPTGTNEYPASNDLDRVQEAKLGRPNTFMNPPTWMNQRPTPLSVDVNVAYVEGREELDRGTSQQPFTKDFLMASSGKRKREDLAQHYHRGSYIPQQDGAGDFESFHQAEVYNYRGVVSEDYNLANTPAPNTPAPTDLQASTPIISIAKNETLGGEEEEEEPSLNEDDDDDDVDEVDQGVDLNTQHLILAQFDKVTRTKSRWKCTLKSGIMHINNKDVLFNKAMGEFEF